MQAQISTLFLFVCLFGILGFFVCLFFCGGGTIFDFFISTEVQVDFEEFLGDHRIMLLCFYYFEWSLFPFPGNI